LIIEDVIPLPCNPLKKEKRAGRFFWKNLEAKPLNFELASLCFIKSRCKGQGLQFTRPL
jgi:hypothetical protein